MNSFIKKIMLSNKFTGSYCAKKPFKKKFQRLFCKENHISNILFGLYYSKSYHFCNFLANQKTKLKWRC